MSKRKLLALVQQNPGPRLGRSAHANDRGYRRRGYTPEAVRDFCARIGVAKKENVIDIALLEHTVREDLNRRALRALAVLRPLKVVIENYPEGRVEQLEGVNNPEESVRRHAPASRSRECFTSSTTTSWRRRRRSSSVSRLEARFAFGMPTS
jgi:glutaminyl-tRNA synthetase